MKYYSIGEFANKIGKTVQTLRNWDKNGTFKPCHVTSGGTRYDSQEQLNYFLGIKLQNKSNKKIIGYCRVSSNKQKDDLERQIENVKTYMYARGYQFEVISDIGSGINYNNKGLNKLLDLVTNAEVDKIVILYKDRLLRFGFELVENLCNKYGTTIEVIDNTEKTEEQELLEDLTQIITMFSCRLQGKRANKVKKMIKELTECDTYEEGLYPTKEQEQKLWQSAHTARFIYNWTLAKQAVKDACNDYKRFFRGLVDKPKFKSKKRSKPSFYNDTDKLKVKDKAILLEKIGWIKIKEQIPI